MIAKVRAREPNLGEGDTSKCLPGWIDTFVRQFETGHGYDMTHNAVGNLCHTLIAAMVRTERLVRERDEALAKIEELINGVSQ